MMVFIKCGKKKFIHLGSHLGPRTLVPASAPRFALCYGPRAETVSREVSTYFFIEFHDNTRGIKILYQNFSCNRLKLKNKTQVIPGHKKKMR